MAECHPVGFQWVEEAKARGARVIHVDPRFTRTSAVSDKHIPIRAGSDVVLLGALINHIITNDLWFKEYVVAYTNAATLINENFRDTEDLGGLFSGYDPETGQYDPSTWAYAGSGSRDRRATAPTVARATRWAAGVRRSPTPGCCATRPCSTRARCSRSSSGITPATPRRWCATSAASASRISTISLRSIVENSGRERTTCFAYAVGWTQHTLGAQFIRTATILQLLMGNVGRPGSGIMALRGHASIQGSTDIPTLFNLLPGYLPMPKAGTHDTLGRLPGRGRVEEAEGLLGQRRYLHGQPAQGMVGRRGPRGQRLGLRLPAAAVRPARHLPDRHGNARRRGGGLLLAGPESRGRVGARPACSASACPT